MVWVTLVCFTISFHVWLYKALFDTYIPQRNKFFLNFLSLIYLFHARHRHIYVWIHLLTLIKAKLNSSQFCAFIMSIIHCEWGATMECSRDTQMWVSISAFTRARILMLAWQCLACHGFIVRYEVICGWDINYSFPVPCATQYDAQTANQILPDNGEASVAYCDTFSLIFWRWSFRLVIKILFIMFCLWINPCDVKLIL